MNTTRGLNIRWCERELSKEIKGGRRRMGERCSTAKQQRNLCSEQKTQVYDREGKRIL